MITIATVRDRRFDTAMLTLRIVAGIVFLAHGWQKFFMTGLDATTGFFSQVGIPFPGIAAPLVAGLELIGGVALIVGVLTRMFSALLAIDMIVAIVFVHLANGFFLPGGMEFALTLFSITLALAVAGAGAMSVDDAMNRNRIVEISETDRAVVREGRRVGTTV